MSGAGGNGSEADRHARARDIFLDLLDLPADARRPALDERCKGDDGLRRDVLSLLGHHVEAEEGPSSEDAARFEAGHVFADRYRIVAELGRGGMGEVYRAQDLLLERPVALKFLPPSKPQHLDKLLNEVRMALQVTHPNVCRVYDFGRAGGETYLTMEYIDGEDLSSLLTRIGRFPRDKLLDIAHQLCAGLAAAHARGVLHRDLKPANIMIDGEGKARITDFGIATETVGDLDPASGTSPRRSRDTAPREAVIVGTPAYMAPEQLAGEPASVRSDIYALGLVLHEMATGQPVFRAETPAAYAALHRTVTPTPPSLHVEHLDPRLEEVILRCLEKDPDDRPASASEVSAALPGGDPLAAALAAGHTPSPETVAAARGGEALGQRGATALLAGLLAVLAAVLALADRAYPARETWAHRPPAVILDRAEQILRELGYPTVPGGAVNGEEVADRAWGFFPGGLDHIGNRDEEIFWFRQGPEPLVPVHYLAILFPRADFDDPPPLDPGMVRTLLDARGHLLALHAVPPAPDEEDGESGPGAAQTAGPRAPPEMDWSTVLAAAGLDGGALEPAPAVAPPPVYADRTAAWATDGKRVRAASYGGRVVFFEVTNLDAGDAAPSLDWDLLWTWYVNVQELFWFVLAAGAVVLARLNLRAGRGDLRGARKVATFVAVLTAAAWMAQVSFFPRLEDLSRWELTLGFLLVQTFVAWLAYVALEPIVRRWWPRALIAWSRLLNGRWRDPQVGASLLIGAAAGGSWVLLTELDRLLTAALDLSPAPEIFISYQLDAALGVRSAVAELLGSGIEAVYRGVLTLFSLVGLRVICKRWSLALAIFIAANGLLETLEGIHPAVSWLTLGLGITVTSALVLLRAGLLAYVVALFSYLSLLSAPLTLDGTAWYAGTGFFLLAVVALVGGYGTWTALGGRGPASGRR